MTDDNYYDAQRYAQLTNKDLIARRQEIAAEIVLLRHLCKDQARYRQRMAYLAQCLVNPCLPLEDK
jgi:hypothetical protein